MEGIVVKNYSRPFLLGDRPLPLMAGKYVSERFKEVNHRNCKSKKNDQAKIDIFKERFRTEARWDKGIQHLRDNGKLENSPRDIGILIKEIQRDVEEEEKEHIKNFLYREFGKGIIRHSTRDFPEYYKKEILKGAFDVLKE